MTDIAPTTSPRRPTTTRPAAGPVTDGWHRSRRMPLVLLAMLLVLLGTACDDDDVATDFDQPGEGPGEAQIAAGDDLVQGALADLPVPTGADAADTAQEVDGVQTQSFVVTAMTPSQVMDFYEAELPDLGWTGGARDAATETVRAAWEMGDLQLLIAAAPHGEVDSSVSLQLSDASTDTTNLNTEDASPDE